jgi:hypothetical protein
MKRTFIKLSIKHSSYCALFLVSIIGFAQIGYAQAPSIQWQKLYGGLNGETANATQQTSDGGYIIAGGTASSNTGDVVGANNGNFDFWIVKTNASGTIQWQKIYGGAGEDIATSIQQTTDGGYIVAGYTNSSNSGNVGTNKGEEDMWLLKLSATGTIQWQKTLGGANNERANAIQQTADGGYIVTGFTESSHSGDVGANKGGRDVWVVKLNSTGTIQWQKNFGGDTQDGAATIHQTTDGGFIVAGYTFSSSTGDVGINKGGLDMWIFKLNTTGTLEWQKNIGGSNDEIAYTVQQTTDGGYIVAGSTTSSNTGNVIGTNKGLSDIWIVKLSGSGIIQWQKLYGGNDEDIATSIKKTSDGGYIVAGSTKSTTNIGVSNGENDFWVAKLSTTGTIQWQKVLGGSADDLSRSVIQTADGGYAIAGSTNSSNSGDVGTNNGASEGTSDFWFVKLTPPCTFKPTITGANSVVAGSKTTLIGSATTGIFKWTSSDTTAAKISQTGVVTALSRGTTIISYTVTEGSCTATAQKNLTITGSRAPIINSITEPSSGYTAYTVNFNANAIDPDGEPLIYEWNFGDGTPKSKLANPSHTFTVSNPSAIVAYKVTLTVKDPNGLTASASTTITVNGQPVGCLKQSIFLNNTTLSGTPNVYVATEINTNILATVSIRWEGTVIPPVTGVYTFTITTDDGSRLWVNNNRIINKWFDQSKNTYNATIYLTKGQEVPIKYEYYHKVSVGGIAQLKWTVPNKASALVPFRQCSINSTALTASQIYTADGYRDGQKGIVTWISNASNADYFNIEKLDKNGNFELLDKINAQVTNDISGKNYYTFTDLQPFDGENTYRIALISDNAPPQYSNPITLDFKAKMDFNVYPNPTSEYIDVDLSAYENRPILLSVIDAAGHTVHFSSIEKAGKTRRVDLNNIATGQYILHIRTVGKRDVTRQFTVSK